MGGDIFLSSTPFYRHWYLGPPVLRKFPAPGNVFKIWTARTSATSSTQSRVRAGIKLLVRSPHGEKHGTLSLLRFVCILLRFFSFVFYCKFCLSRPSHTGVTGHGRYNADFFPRRVSSRAYPSVRPSVASGHKMARTPLQIGHKSSWHIYYRPDV